MAEIDFAITKMDQEVYMLDFCSALSGNSAVTLEFDENVAK